jgi:predicted DNA-binding mobile mystery protein A
MRPQERLKARRSLDKKLNSLTNSEISARPPAGWIKAIREALGMTTAQLGARMGVTQPRAVQIERAEKDRKISLESLERAAQALGCRLVYALVPHDSLEAQVRDRARLLAKRRLSSISHNMALEDQSISNEDEKAQLEHMIEKLLDAPGSRLWDEP